MPSFLTCLFCPSKMGRLKIIGLFETEIYFLRSLGHVASGAKRERRAFMMSRRLCVFPGSVSFQ